MKLSSYLPEVPALAQQMSDLNGQINMLQLMKASGDTGSAPTIGLDHVVNTWVRHQMAYRQQLVMDLQTIAMSVEEIRGPLNHITSEVFRRGFDWEPKSDDADSANLDYFKTFLTSCNVFDQSLEEVLRQVHFDLNSIDDCFIYLAKEYYDDKGTLQSKVKEIRRLNPALVEFDLDNAGLPKNYHFLCPIHREEIHEAKGICPEAGCKFETQPVMYKYYHRNKHLYLFESEIIHLSKFSPSETYGWSPILTIFEKALTLIGMDKNLYRYFFERKMPGSMMMVFTDDPESLRRERANLAAQTRLDPNFVPMVAVSSKNNRGRVDMVRLFHTLQEMDYLPVRAEIRERVSAMWGVTPAWQGSPEAFGGLSTQTQQLVVMSRVVEGDQRLFHEKVFPQLLEAFGVTDWNISLRVPEEKAEATRISFAQQRVSMASQLNNMGFTIKLKEQGVIMEDAQFMIEGEVVPIVQIQGEQQALALEEQQEMADEPIEKAIPGQERDIDAWAAARDKKGEDRQWGYRRLPGRPPKGATKEMIKSTTWVESLMNQGFPSPVIKEVNDDGKQLWFISDGVDYVGDILSNGHVFVEKATFANPSISYAPTQTTKKRLERNNVQGEPYMGETIEDSEDN
tara:strand:+ start:1314 stop:3188 length:1875 start_codon:yes stop_codon:yes gene_type:complete